MSEPTTDRETIDAIIRRASVCRIGLSDDARPYVVPVCFGYEGDTLYFHSAPRGRKLDVLRRNNRVCFEFDVDVEIVPAKSACGWSMRFRSVVGFGDASLVEDLEGKRKALDVIVTQYGGQPGEYAASTLEKTAVVKIEIQSMTARVSDADQP
jgi:nitroimidazol reductase NimA-like FMN-containing flavoprotein (pyridoxamine 5'-phosphate oxidase superfamily)